MKKVLAIHMNFISNLIFLKKHVLILFIYIFIVIIVFKRPMARIKHIIVVEVSQLIDF